MQATIQCMPRPGRMTRAAGYSHEALLVLQLREGYDPDKDAAIDVAIESIALAATAVGELFQLTVPLKALLRTSPDERYKHVIGDDRVRMAIVMLLGEDFAQTLIERANGQLGWETSVQVAITPQTLEQQRRIVLWLDFMAKQLKSPQLAEFTSRTSWELEDRPVA